MPVLSVVREEEDVVTAGESAERPTNDVGPARKRKRRRRRGQRDRSVADAGDTNGAADGDESSESADFEGAESPYASAGRGDEDGPSASRSEGDEERTRPPRVQSALPAPPTEPDVRPAAAPPASTPLTDNNE